MKKTGFQTEYKTDVDKVTGGRGVGPIIITQKMVLHQCGAHTYYITRDMSGKHNSIGPNPIPRPQQADFVLPTS